MKTSFIFLFLSLSTLPALAQSQIQKEMDQKIKDEMEASKLAADKLTGGIVQIQEDKRIEELLGTSADFKDCKDAFIAKASASTNVDDLPTECLKIIKIENGKADKAALEDLAKNLNLTFFSPNGTPNQGSKNYAMVRAYLEKRLQNALYGEKGQAGKVATVDHKNFYDLYATQISKSFLLDASAYCSEVYSTSNADYSTTDEATIKSKTYAVGATAQKQMADNYQACLVSLPCQCYGTPTVAGQPNACDIKDDKGNQKTYTPEPKYKNKACTLVTRLKQMKQQMLYLENLDKDWEAAFAGNGGHFKGGSAQYDPAAEDKSINDLTTFTSSDYQEAVTGLSDQTKDLNTKCQTLIAQGGDLEKLKQDGTCSNLNIVDKDKIAEMTLQHQLTTKALLQNIDDMKEDEFKEYIKNQKLSQDISDMIEKSNDWQDARKVIRERLLSERQAVIDELNEQLKKSAVITEKKNGKEEISGDSKDTELLGRAETQEQRTARLIHYTNVVSAYLQVDVDGKQSYNTKALEREISSVSKEVDKSGGKAYFGQLKTNTQDQIKKGGTASKSVLSSDSIDKILNSGN